MTDQRISRHEMLIGMAIKASERSTCRRRKVGAIIAVDGRPVSVGYCGATEGMPHCIDVGCIIGVDGGCLRTTHAESNAIAFAARKGVATELAVLYTTVSPCMVCAKLALAAGIRDIVFLEEYRDTKPLQFLHEAGARYFWVEELIENEKKHASGS